MQPEKYVRKPFEIEAVQVTTENMTEVEAWCKGEIIAADDSAPFIKVKVFKPMGERQTQAYAGDWVLFFNGGFKVYLDSSFTRSFDKVDNGRTFDEVVKDAGITASAIPGNAFNPSPTPSEIPVEDLRVK